MNSCKKTRTFAGASWWKNLLECNHVAPAHEPLLPPTKKKGKDRSSKIFANAALLFPFSISLLRSCCGVQLSSMARTDVEDQCIVSRRCCYCCSLTTAKLCRPCWWPFRHLRHSFEARHPSWPTAYIHVGVQICFQMI